MFFSSCIPSYAAWIWTPESKGWINPKHGVKDTSQEQLTWASGLYESAEYKRALNEFNKLVRYYPNSMHAPMAQYYTGRCYEDMESYYSAFMAYQKVIDSYPYAKNREEIIMRQYKIGMLFFDGQKAKILGLAVLPAIDRAIEIFEKVVTNSPYGEYADKAQFKIGESYKKSNRFAEAALSFQKLIDDYPQSGLSEAAAYEVAQCGYMASLGYSYDQRTTDAAIEKFEEFIDGADGNDLSEEAKAALTALKEKKAKGIYDTAIFYEKTGQHLSAVVYHKELIDNYPDSALAAESLNRVIKLEEKLSKKKR
jgi:outer membrane assembly lipoprotein YfiO